MSRALVTVFSSDKLDGKSLAKQSTVPLPDVFSAPIRTDIIRQMHTFQRMNLRHPHSLFKFAAHQTAAESWGTGRAVARIPRVTGSGTHRAGQGAFGNMCRGGRMFAPKKTWRRWAHVIKRQEKKYALTGAIAATGVTSLVMARGHKIDRIAEVPLVVSDDIQSFTQTKVAFKFLKNLKAIDDVLKVKNTKKVRSGKGKSRNRKHKERKGPLIIYAQNNGLTKAFRNIAGVETMSVNRLNLLSLAPGGQVGRFVIWTESAFKELQELFGSYSNKGDSKVNRKSGVKYHLPRPMMTNTDLDRIIQSDEIQSVIRPRVIRKRIVRKKNPLKNFYAMVKLNPFALPLKRLEIKSREKKEKALYDPKHKPSLKVLKQQKLEKESIERKKKFNEKLFNFDN
jgi:large subunit ribosomal protein L4e